MLNKFIKMCLLMICLCSSLYSHATYLESDRKVQSNKCYLAHEQLEISNNQILLVTENGVQPISQIFSDECGIYTIVDDQNLIVGVWNCPRCGALNPSTRWDCGRCNWPN